MCWWGWISWSLEAPILPQLLYNSMTVWDFILVWGLLLFCFVLCVPEWHLPHCTDWKPESSFPDGAACVLACQTSLKNQTVITLKWIIPQAIQRTSYPWWSRNPGTLWWVRLHSFPFVRSAAQPWKRTGFLQHCKGACVHPRAALTCATAHCELVNEKEQSTFTHRTKQARAGSYTPLEMLPQREVS